MVYIDLIFDPLRDIEEICDALDVDLAYCLKTGAVPEIASDLSYNQQSIDEVGERIHDSFDAIAGQTYYDRLSRAAIENPN